MFLLTTVLLLLILALAGTTSARNAAGGGRSIFEAKVCALQVPLGCRDKSKAEIKKPHTGEIVSGTVEIRGKASGRDFSYYTLSFARATDPENWTTICTCSEPVNNGKLGEWDTTINPDGTYLLKLTVFLTSGQTAEDQVEVRLDNNPPSVSFISPTDGGVVQQVFDVIGTVTDANLERWKLSCESLSPLLLSHFNGNTVNERTGDEGDEYGNPSYQQGKFSQGIHIGEGQGLTYQTKKNIEKDAGTIELWVIPDWPGDESGTHVFLQTKTSDPSHPTNSLRLAKDERNLTFTVYDGTGRSRSCSIPVTSSTLPAGVPFHLAATWENGNLTLALNGYPSGPAQGDGSGVMTDLSKKVYVGFYPNTSYEADATLDELSIYPYTRTISQGRTDCLSGAPKNMGSRKKTIAQGQDPVENSILGTVNTSDSPGERLSLTLEAKDKAGRETTTTESLYIDNPAPTALITTPAEGSEVEGEVILKGTTFDMDLSSYTLSCKAGSDPNGPGSWTQFASSTQAVWYNALGVWTASGLPSGPYVIRLEVADASGKVAQSFLRLTVKVTGPPLVEISSPAEGQAVLSPVGVTGTVRNPNLDHWELTFRELSPSFLSHFDGNTKNERDGSEGQLSGSPSFSQGKFSQGLFLGQNDQLSYPTSGNISKDKGTIELWVKPTWSGSESVSHTLFATSPPTAEMKNMMMVGKGKNSVSFIVIDEQGGYRITTMPVDDVSMPAGVPFHLAATWKNGDLELFLNGVKAPAATGTGSGIVSEMGQAFYAGSFFQPGMGASATIDELSIYPEARDQSTILEDFHASAPRTYAVDWSTFSTGTNQVENGTLGTINTAALPGEKAQVRLSMTDRGGESQESIRSLIMDSPTPRGDITFPVNGELLFETVEVKGTASDIDFSSYELSYKSGTDPGSPEPWQPIGTPYTNPVYGGPLGTWDTRGLPNGEYCLRLKVTDMNGRESQTDRVVLLNNDVPTAELTFPSNEGGAPEACEIRGSACGINFSGYSLSYKSGHDPDSPSPWLPVGSEHSEPVQNGTLETWDTTGLGEGPFLLRLTVHGIPGMEVVRTAAVYVDHTLPVARITSPTPSIQKGLVKVEGTATDEHFAEYRLEYASDDNPTEWLPIGEPSAEQVTEGFLGWWDTAVLPEGTYILRLTALDIAGHDASASVTLEVTAETPWSPVAISAWPEGALLEVGESQSFTCVAQDTEGFLHAVPASWQAEGGLGTMSQDGLFTASTLGHGRAIASFEGFTCDAPLAVATILTDTVLSGDTTFSPAGNPYVLGSWVVVPEGKTLTLEPGTVMKVDSGGFLVEGSMVCEASEDDPVRFTSLADDDVLGDTNVDRDDRLPGWGDWSGISISSSSMSPPIRGLSVSYAGAPTDEGIVGGGHVTSRAAVTTFQSNPVFNYCRITFSASDGIDTSNASPTIENTEFIAVAGYGLFAQLGLRATLRTNTFEASGGGARLWYINAVTVEGNNTFSGMPSGLGLEVRNPKGVTLNNNQFTSCMIGALIGCESAPGGIDIIGNTFTDCGYQALGTLVIEATNSKTSVYGNIFNTSPESDFLYALSVSPGTNETEVRNNEISGYSNGIVVGAHSHASVHNNIVLYNGQVGASGIAISNGGDETPAIGESAECYENQVSGRFQYGISTFADSKHYFTATTIRKNQISGSGIAGVGCIYRDTGGVFAPASVIVDDNDISGYTSGVVTENYNSVEVTINRITTGEPMGMRGVSVTRPDGGTGASAIVRENPISSGESDLYTGIEVSGYQSAEVSGHYLSVSGRGILCSEIGSLNLTNNHVSATSPFEHLAGIECSSLSGTLSGNTVSGGRTGLKVVGCYGLQVVANTVSGFSWYGIDCLDSSVDIIANPMIAGDMYGIRGTNSEIYANGNAITGADWGIACEGGSATIQTNTFTGTQSGDMRAIECSSMPAATVEWNVVSGYQYGIACWWTDHVEVNGNRLYGKQTGDGLSLSSFAGSARGNHISGFSCGVWAADPLDYPELNNNTIQMNGWGCSVNGPGRLDARYNWWGAADGPDPYGTCNGVFGPMDVQPWVGQTCWHESKNGLDENSDYEGEPVNVSTGNFFQLHTDIDFPATGPQITLKRSYNSIGCDVDGPFGPGWNFTYSKRIEQYLSDFPDLPEAYRNDKVLIGEEGDYKHYVYQGDDTWLPEDEDYTVLRREADSIWKLTFKDGGYERYTLYPDGSPQGRILLTAITDSRGNTLSVARDESGKALSVTDACGQTTTFDYDVSGRIDLVTDPAGRSVSYAYDENGNLAEVHDLNGGIARYTYDPGHRMLSVADPIGNEFVRNSYDELNRVIEQEDAFGMKIHFNYDQAAHSHIFTNALGAETTIRDNRRLDVTGRTDALGGETAVGYDAQGNVTSRTDKNNKTTAYTYDSRGNVLSETDPLGNTTSHTYDERGNCLSTTDKLGNVTVRTYDGKNNLLSETDPLVNTTTYTYDEAGRQLTSADPLGRLTSNTYDSRGNLVQVVNPDGGVTVNVYDSANRKTSTTDPLGHTTTYAYDTMGHLLTETNSLGNTTSYEYDADGNQVAEIDPLGGRKETVYDAMGRVKKEIDPLGGTVEYHYWVTGQLMEEHDQLGNRRKFYWRDELGRVTHEDGPRYPGGLITYDANGNVLTEADRKGNVTTYAYDACGRRTSETDPLGNTTSHTYDATGREISTTDPMGHTTASAYDATGRLISTTDAEGQVTSYAYDQCGNKVSEADPDGNTTTYTYDSMNRLVSTTDPEGRTVTTAYDLNGNRISSTDGTGATTTFSYNSRGLLSSVTDPVGSSVSYTGDACGRKTSQTHPNGGVDNYTYDACGRLTSERNPIGEETTYTYDAAGRMTEKTDGEGTTTYTRDFGGLPTRVDYPNYLSETAIYDENDRPTEQAGGGMGLRYTYDEAGRLSSASNGFSTTTATYDASGNVTGKTLATLNGETKNFSYDFSPSGRMTGVTDENGTATFSYSPSGRLLSKTYPNGVVTDYAYDRSGATSALEISKDTLSIKRYEVHRDGRANVTSITEDSSQTTTYSYDTASHLTGESNTWMGNTAYSYDADGNRLAKNTDGQETTYTYDLSDQLLSDSTGTTYTYNQRGDLVREENGAGYRDYYWDGKGRLTSTYDSIPNKPYYFAYDPLDRTLLSGTGMDDARIYSYDMKSDCEMATLDMDWNIATTFTSGADGLASSTEAGATAYYAYNPHGDLALVTDESGNVASELHYDAWGNTAEPTEDPFNYLGKHMRRDYPSLGLIKMGARYYNSESGKFITHDLFAGRTEVVNSINAYMYAYNDPVNRTDLSGMDVFSSPSTSQSSQRPSCKTIPVKDIPIKVLRLRVISAAFTQLGVPFVLGGKWHNNQYMVEISDGVWIRCPGLDCSGFVQYSFMKVFGRFPGDTYSQFSHCRVIKTFSEALPADLIFYGDQEHVAIYLGGLQTIEETSTVYFPAPSFPFGYVQIKHAIYGKKIPIIIARPKEFEE